jgi:type IV secretion system protein VirB10
VLGRAPPLPDQPPTSPSPTPAVAAPLAQVAAYAPQPKTPGQLAFERRLAGPVFAPRSPGDLSHVSSRPDPSLHTPTPGSPEASPLPVSIQSDPHQGLASLLQPTLSATVLPSLLPTRRFLLSKGAFIDCTLETAIDSTLPGMTTCITATDTYSTDGTVVLMERGTKLVGETRGQVGQGTARIFVLWTEARTPTGVVVPLASPGTDELGRSGLPGQVDRHFWDRFGAAILLSIVNGAVQAGVQAASSGNNSGAVVVNPSATTDVMTEVLRSTVAIAPTVTKQQGDRIQVLVARDVDFRSVYDLRIANTAQAAQP